MYAAGSIRPVGAVRICGRSGILRARLGFGLSSTGGTGVVVVVSPYAGSGVWSSGGPFGVAPSGGGSVPSGGGSVPSGGGCVPSGGVGGESGGGVPPAGWAAATPLRDSATASPTARLDGRTITVLLLADRRFRTLCRPARPTG